MINQPRVSRRATTPVSIQVQVDDIAFVTADAIARPVIDITVDVITQHGVRADYPREVVIVVENDREADAFRARLEQAR